MMKIAQEAYRGGKNHTREERQEHDSGRRNGITVKRASRTATTVVDRRKGGTTVRNALSARILVLVVATVCRTVEEKQSHYNRVR